MKTKRIFIQAAVLALAFFILFQGTAVAETVSSDQKQQVAAAAAREILPTQPNEKDVKITKDDAIKRAKAVLDGEDNYDGTNAWLNPRYGSACSTWNIDFYRTRYPSGNASVSIDADTGAILSFNIWNGGDPQKNYIAKITRNEAMVIAADFLENKMNFDMDTFEIRKEDPYIYSYKVGGVKEQVLYNFNYVKKIDGIALNECNVTVGVDGTDGKVRNYSSSPLDISSIKLQPKEGILTAEQAGKKYTDASKMRLQYINFYKEGSYLRSFPEVRLVYVPVMYMGMMDAVSGKLVNYDGSMSEFSTDVSGTMPDNPAPMDPGARLESKAITKDEAQKLAQGYKALAETLLGVKFSNDAYNSYGPYGYSEEEFWNKSWFMNSPETNASASVSINIATGHVVNLSFNKYLAINDPAQLPEVNEKVNWKQGKELAAEALGKIAPDLYGFYSDQNIEEPSYTVEAKKTMREYYYSYIRVINGVLYRDNAITIGIDRATGRVSNFYLSWNDIDIPEKEKIISMDEAKKIFLEGMEPSLSYFIKRTWDPKTQVETIGSDAILVYSFNIKGWQNGYLMIDAITGKPKDWSGKEVIPGQAASEPKFSGHWAGRSAELLIGQGILNNPEIKLEESISRAEAVKMLSLAKGMNYYDNSYSGISFADVKKDDEFYSYVENAVKQKIITEVGGNFEGAEAITKGEFAKLLVNMMGYGSIAGHDSIFKVDGMKNIPAGQAGYAAVCDALDVLPVKPGETFDAAAGLTWGEAAYSLYKALEFIR